ncbi:MAG: photosynthetic complex assembly protein PuhC [Chromatocurvus sp.]
MNPLHWSPTRWLATAVGAIVIMTVATVAAMRLSGFTPDTSIDSPVVHEVALRFVDIEGGEVHVFEETSGRRVATLEPAQDSFIRGVMRGMARERRSRDIDMKPPFNLISYADGSMIVEDPSVGMHINLVAFGPTNIGSFRTLLNKAVAATR